MPRTLQAIGCLFSLLLSTSSMSGDLNHVLPMPASPLYKQECGSCHTAYAPTYLPARAWNKLMGELERHFGDDASLAKPERDLLNQQLQALAGDTAAGVASITTRNARMALTDTPMRITATPFFAHLHDEVPASIWKRGKIGSKANCGACHPRADEGRYFEQEIRIPK